MRILIAYASKSGTVEKCAKLLAEKLPDAELADLKKTRPSPLNYDIVLLGGAIRAGGMTADTRKYADANKDELCKVKLGLFMCSGSDDKVDEYFSRNLPESIVKHAFIKKTFGGEIAPERAHGFEKYMMKSMLKSAEKNNSVMKIYPERINEYAKVVLAQ